MHSEDIVIRPYQIGDAPLLFEAATESVAEVYRWLPWCHPGYSIGESEARVVRMIAFLPAENLTMQSFTRSCVLAFRLRVSPSNPRLERTGARPARHGRAAVRSRRSTAGR